MCNNEELDNFRRVLFRSENDQMRRPREVTRSRGFRSEASMFPCHPTEPFRYDHDGIPREQPFDPTATITATTAATATVAEEEQRIFGCQSEPTCSGRNSPSLFPLNCQPFLFIAVLCMRRKIPSNKKNSLLLLLLSLSLSLNSNEISGRNRVSARFSLQNFRNGTLPLPHHLIFFTQYHY